MSIKTSASRTLTFVVLKVEGPLVAVPRGQVLRGTHDLDRRDTPPALCGSLCRNFPRLSQRPENPRATTPSVNAREKPAGWSSGWTPCPAGRSSWSC